MHDHGFHAGLVFLKQGFQAGQIGKPVLTQNLLNDIKHPVHIPNQAFAVQRNQGKAMTGCIETGAGMG